MRLEEWKWEGSGMYMYNMETVDFFYFLHVNWRQGTESRRIIKRNEI